MPRALNAACGSALSPSHALRRDWAAPNSAGCDVTHEAEPSTSHERAKPVWRCVACGYRIADPETATEVAGSHHHHRINPAGFAYRIACFTLAPGCRMTAERMARHSWFPPHRWRHAWCRGCGRHLGWAFDHAGATRYYGLIRDHLTLRGAADSA